MEAEDHNLRSSHEILGFDDKKTSGNSRTFVDGSVVETFIVVKQEEEEAATSRAGENKDLELKDCELGSTKAVVEGFNKVIDGSSEVSSPVEHETNANSTSSDVGVVFKTSVVVNPDEAPVVNGDDREFSAKVDEVGLSKLSIEESKTKLPEAERDSCVIDINCGSAKGCVDKWDGEMVCRICHLSSDQSPDRATATMSSTTADLIHLGCGCKDELGIAHGHCAETWFKLKGNRMCEICGETAKNVTGVGDIRFMEWNERRLTRSNGSTSEGRGGCWRGQPFCNFLMACLVIAFVLPWFFRVNMFS